MTVKDFNSNKKSEQTLGPLYYQPNPDYPRLQMRPNMDLKPDQVQQAVERVRARILQLNEENSDRFSQKLIDRVRNNDFEVRRFLYQCDMKEKDAEQMLINKLEAYRKLDFDLINDQQFPQEFYQIGGLFEYEADIDGGAVLYMRPRFHRKIGVQVFQENLEKSLLYTADKIDQRVGTTERTWSIVLDMQGFSLSNVDFDMAMLMIRAVRECFPYSIRYVAVVEMPWLVQTVWKALERLMPESVRSLIMMTDRKRLAKIIPLANLPDFMGGKCQRCYRQVPEGVLPVEVIAAKHYNMSKKEVQNIMVHFEKYLPSPVKSC